MIVKFDHISYSCSLLKEESARQLFSEYETVFHEKDLPNLAMKYPYMRKEQTTHNIMLLQKAGSYPIEITAYEACEKRAEGKTEKYVLSDDKIDIYSANPMETKAFFALLGFKENEEGILELKPLLDEKPLCIKVCKLPEESTDTHTCFLDEEGFGSLAFVVDNAKKQKALFKEKDYPTSEIEELMVNGKKLKIFFTNSPMGEIIEFIGMR